MKRASYHVVVVVVVVQAGEARVRVLHSSIYLTDYYTLSGKVGRWMMVHQLQGRPQLEKLP